MVLCARPKACRCDPTSSHDFSLLRRRAVHDVQVVRVTSTTHDEMESGAYGFPNMMVRCISSPPLSARHPFQFARLSVSPLFCLLQSANDIIRTYMSPYDFKVRRCHLRPCRPEACMAHTPPRSSEALDLAVAAGTTSSILFVSLYRPRRVVPW